MVEPTTAARAEANSLQMTMPIAVRIARALLYLSGAVWLGFGVITLMGASDYLLAALGESFRQFLFAVMAVNAALMAAAGFFLGSGRRIAWYFALAVLAVNIALTFTDDVGFADWATAGLDAVIVGLLIGARAWFGPVRQG